MLMTRSSLAIAAGSATAAIASYYLSRAISKYGAKGFVRLIWEGDHLEPNVREAWDALDGLEASAVPREEKRLEKVEIAFETARLNSVDARKSSVSTGKETKSSNFVLTCPPLMSQSL